MENLPLSVCVRLGHSIYARTPSLIKLPVRVCVCVCVCVYGERERADVKASGGGRERGVLEEEDRWLFDTQTLCTFPSALMFI